MNKFRIFAATNNKIIHIMKSKALKSNNLHRKFTNENYIIRLDGWKGTTIEIHSAVGYQTAIDYCGKDKFIEIVTKATKKGGDKCKLKANHKLTVTLYNR